MKAQSIPCYRYFTRDVFCPLPIAIGPQFSRLNAVYNNKYNNNNNNTRSVVAMTRDQMEQIRFRGRGAVIWLGTPPVPTHTHSHMC